MVVRHIAQRVDIAVVVVAMMNARHLVLNWTRMVIVIAESFATVDMNRGTVMTFQLVIVGRRLNRIRSQNNKGRLWLPIR